MNIGTINSRRPRCQRCGCLADLIWCESAETRERLYGLHLKHDLQGFVRELRQETGCELAEAKATYQHLAAPGLKCHRCGTALGSEELVDCPKCKSLNLQWAAAA